MLMVDRMGMIHFATALFVIANPIGAVPIFLSLTADQPEITKKRTARSAALTVGALLTIAVICGEPVLQGFGIELPAFQVGGGLLFLLMAVSMLNAQPSRVQHTAEEVDEAQEKESIGVAGRSPPRRPGGLEHGDRLLPPHPGLGGPGSTGRHLLDARGLRLARPDLGGRDRSDPGPNRHQYHESANGTAARRHRRPVRRRWDHAADPDEGVRVSC